MILNKWVNSKGHEGSNLAESEFLTAEFQFSDSNNSIPHTLGNVRMK